MTMNNIYHIHNHAVGDLVQVDLGPERGIHQGLIIGRFGRKLRVLFGPNASLLLRPGDISANLTKAREAK